MPPNHYATLGVAPDSDDVVIRAAFKAMMLKYHPDTNKSAEATKRAAALNAAFAVIGDPQKRAAYDALRKPRQSAPPAPPSPPPKPPPPPAPPPSAPPTPPPAPPPAPAKQIATGATSRWTQVGGWVAGVLVIGLIRVGLQAASSSHSPTPAAMTIDNTTVTDMNSTMGMDAMSDNMTAVDGTLNGGIMANDSTPVQPAKLGDATPVDFGDVENAAQSFARVIDKSGMMGARAWSENCHKAVESAPTWAAADRCAAFDYAAHYLDVGYSQAAGKEPIGYFAFAADNQADQYTRLGAIPYLLIDRFNRIEKAVGPATNEAVSGMIARSQARRAAADRDIERAIRQSPQATDPASADGFNRP